MQRRSLRTAIGDGNSCQHIVWTGLRVLREDIKVAAVIENTGIEQFKLGIVLSTTAVFLHQPLVGKFSLRIFVERPHVGVRRRGVEKVVTLLHVLAVVAFGAAEAK